MGGEHLAAADLAQVVEHRARERRGIRVGERRRQAAHGDRAGPQDREVEAQRSERVRVLLDRGHVDRIRGEGGRHQQRLHWHATPGSPT